MTDPTHFPATYAESFAPAAADAPPQDIISDEEITRVHANANFGSMDKRDVVKWDLLKIACGYHTGHTARTILLEHKLTRECKRNHRYPPELVLTPLGKKYLWASFGDGYS